MLQAVHDKRAGLGLRGLVWLIASQIFSRCKPARAVSASVAML